MYIKTIYYPNYISHHGIKGQHWGIRRYQNEDGTYTAEGKARRSANLTKDYRSTAESGMKSKNRFLGRKLFASKKERIARGKDLSEAGQTQGKAIVRAVGRYAVGFAVSTGAAAVAGFTAGMALPIEAAIVTSYGIGTGISAATFAYNVSSISRAVQDVRDISAYKNSKD